MRYWLIKSEPEVYSIDDLKRDRSTLWTGVRNYQARNFMCEMEPGDELLFYHSNASPSGIAGLAMVAKKAKADPTQFEKNSEYFDAKASHENPRWFSPEVRFNAKFTTFLSIEKLRGVKELGDMMLLRRGSRLSVQPVTEREYRTILKLAG